MSKTTLAQETSRVLKTSSFNEAGSILMERAQERLKQGQLLFEKCELETARQNFVEALGLGDILKNPQIKSEAMVWLLRLASEALDPQTIRMWDEKLDELERQYPDQVTPMIWYGRGIAASYDGRYSQARRCFFKYLKLASKPDEKIRAWIGLSHMARNQGHLNRAKSIVQVLINRNEGLKHRALSGSIFLSYAGILDQEGEYEEALAWVKKAHAAFLEEHNWYHHLYVLYWYARLARGMKNFAQAKWNLDLIEGAVFGTGFRVLKREVEKERECLAQNAVDLAVDVQKAVVQTRENKKISLGKQYVLVDILKALADAHDNSLTKAQLVERVWSQKYRPEAHDNKLYYNINRLRKLIEPDMKNPTYLMNWKEGYRFAPHLRVQLINEVRRK